MLGYERATSVSRSGSAVIERFITSSHGVELFYTVVGGNIHLSATADRYTYKNGRTSVPLPVAEVFPSILAEQMRREIDPAVRNMLKDIGIENGPVLIQALYENGEFFVYEMAYRLTGEQHYRLFEKQGGVGISRMMIALALGEDVSSYDNEGLDDDKFIYPSVNYAVLLEPGVIRFVDGLDRVYKIEEVISYNLTHGDGDVIRPSGDYSHMLIRVNMVARDYGSLCRAVEKVNSYVRVVSEDGRDMVSVRFSLPNGI